MTTITINERTAKGRLLLSFLEKFDGENYIAISKTPNSETKKAIAEATSKKDLVTFKNSSDLFQDLGI